MALIHNLGFPRIGSNRELKFALEAFWQGKQTEEVLLTTAEQLRKTHWQYQHQLDFLTVGDFALYDHVLDTSFMLGNIPERLKSKNYSELESYFLLARGKHVSTAHATDPQSINTNACHDGCDAQEMTKWFDTNYHYIVPEIDENSVFNLNADRLLAQLEEAKTHSQQKTKVVLIGPVTYLWLCNASNVNASLHHLQRLIAIYTELFQLLYDQGVEWIQIDEPILVTELDEKWKEAYLIAYQAFQVVPIKLLLTTYFGKLEDNLELVCKLPVAGLHIDAINVKDELVTINQSWGKEKVLSVGIIDGRNIWKCDLDAALKLLEPIAKHRGDNLWLAPSCSLLHVPITLKHETKLDDITLSWLSFALEKLDELSLLNQALNTGRESVSELLALNKQAILSRKNSANVHLPEIQNNMKQISESMSKRDQAYAGRAFIQRKRLRLPRFPTTTIGSFPQTAEIRQIRRKWKLKQINNRDYHHAIEQEIAHAIKTQETIGLDVLVHGEAERNDMVEYFAGHLAGFLVTEHGWVQSYGSRCVKPPIIFGDIHRTSPITVKWTSYAQSLTHKPVKGMLTGPVTMLNWSFVRDDQPRKVTCQQLALAIRAEVADLEAVGINIIQIDEAALREGLPLRHSQWNAYLAWAIDAFKLSSSGVKNETQIHTHMCYSEFKDIMSAIIQMDADVLTIETARSNMGLLNTFCEYDYPNEIGPGIYDIHSPNIPTVPALLGRLRKINHYVNQARLWVNPDCGLKTRHWNEVIPALTNMVEAAKILRRDGGDLVSE